MKNKNSSFCHHVSRLTAISALAVICWATSLASAQAQQRQLAYDNREVSTYGPAQGDWEFTLGGGGSSARDFDNNAFALNGSIGYFLTPGWEVALRQSFNFSDMGGSRWAASTRGAVDYHFDLQRFRPFVGANFGGIYGHHFNDSWAAGLETGLKYYVHPRTFLLGMLEYQWLFNNGHNVDEGFKNGQFIYTLGIGFNF